MHFDNQTSTDREFTKKSTTAIYVNNLWAYITFFIWVNDISTSMLPQTLSDETLKNAPKFDLKMTAFFGIRKMEPQEVLWKHLCLFAFYFDRTIYC